MPGHPIAFVRGKIESRVRDSVDIAVAVRWNAVEISLLPRRPMLAQPSLDRTGRDRVHHDALARQLDRKHLAQVHGRRLRRAVGDAAHVAALARYRADL